jgi:hypothetical protein
VLSTFLSKQDLEWDFTANLWQPLHNDPNAPVARYFVIHDTSGPNFGHRPFPPDIDVNPKINNLTRFKFGTGTVQRIKHEMEDLPFRQRRRLKRRY